MDFKTLLDTAVITFGDDTVITVGRILGAIGILIVGWILSHLISRLILWRFANTQLTGDTKLVARKILQSVLVIFVIFAALGYLNLPLTAFTFLSGAVAIGVGFGAQNIINNFISGWILLSERPVRIGDFVEIDGSQGTVEYVGNRSTRIKRVDGVHLLLPNSAMLERTLINWTLTDSNIRTIVSVGVAYGSPVKRVEELLYQVVNEHPLVLKEPAPLVIFESFGDNSLQFDAYFWCHVSREGNLRKIRSEMRFRIDELFAENAITIAFPQRDVHLHSNGPLDINVVQPKVPE